MVEEVIKKQDEEVRMYIEAKESRNPYVEMKIKYLSDYAITPDLEEFLSKKSQRKQKDVSSNNNH